FRARQAVQHLPSPLVGPQVHDSGGRRGRYAGDTELPGQVAGGTRPVRGNDRRSLPVCLRQRFLILHEVAETVADGPRSTDQVLHPTGAAESFQTSSVVLRQRLIIPTDGPADLVAEPVHPTGGVLG